MKNWSKYIVCSTFFSWRHPSLPPFAVYFSSPASLFLFLYAEVTIRPSPSFPCLSCFIRFFFLLPPQFLPPPFCRTLYCVHAPPSLSSSAEAKTPVFPSVSVKSKKFAPMPSHFWNVTPMIFSALSISLHKLPVCLPFWASLYPPPLPPLTSPPSLQLNLSLPELTLSLAFALTGQSPRAVLPRLYLIRHLPLPLPVSLSPSLQLFTHSSLSGPQGK